MTLSETQVRLITVQVRVTELQVGDQVGPSDVTLPITYTVVGVPERTSEQIAARSPLALRVRTLEGVESILTPTPATRVFVRRYVARVTRTQGEDNTLDPVPSLVMLRPADDVLTIIDAGPLRLRAHDSLTFTAA